MAFWVCRVQLTPQDSSESWGMLFVETEKPHRRNDEACWLCDACIAYSFTPVPSRMVKKLKRGRLRHESLGGEMRNSTCTG